MPAIRHWNLTLTQGEVLERLPLSSPAFSARSAPDLVAGILCSIESGALIEPAASYEFHGLGRVLGRRLELAGGAAMVADRPLTAFGEAEEVLFAAWSLGPGISGAVSGAFAGGNYLQGLVLDEIASLLLFRLGERLFDRLDQQRNGQAESIGKPVAPGDGALALSVQETVLSLAGAHRIGVECGPTGSMSPHKSASALAPVGRFVRRPPRWWFCQDCRTRKTCRLGHGDGEFRECLH